MSLTHEETLALVDGARERLGEAARYAGPAPDRAAALAADAEHRLRVLGRGCGPGRGSAARALALADNLSEALRYLRCDADVLRGYAYGARLELLQLRSALAKGPA